MSSANSMFTPASAEMLTIHEENTMLNSFVNYVDSKAATSAGYLNGVEGRAKSFTGVADCDREEIDFLRGTSEFNLLNKLNRAKHYAENLEVSVQKDGASDDLSLRITSKDLDSRYTSKEFADDLNRRSDTKDSKSSKSSRRSAQDFMGDMLAEKRSGHHKSRNILLAGAEKFRAFTLRDTKKC